MSNQEGLPDYWGIETQNHNQMASLMRLHYLTVKNMRLQPELLRDQEGLPDYWGIETFARSATPVTNQEGLPEYLYFSRSEPNQEGLPDYWGIETSSD